MEEFTNTQISYPNAEIWFICWNDGRNKITAYGSVLPTQVMETAWHQLDYFDNKNSYKEVLLENGIEVIEHQ
mgnify:FL=1